MLDDTFYFSIYKTKSNYKVEKKEKSLTKYECALDQIDKSPWISTLVEGKGNFTFLHFAFYTDFTSFTKFLNFRVFDICEPRIECCYIFQALYYFSVRFVAK